MYIYACTSEIEREREGLTDGYGDLAFRRCVGGTLDALPALIEDPRYAIGLGEYGTVAEAQTEPKSDSQNCAVPLGRLAQYDKAHEVTRENTNQKNEAELAARGHYHWRPVEPDALLCVPSTKEKQTDRQTKLALDFIDLFSFIFDV